MASHRDTMRLGRLIPLVVGGYIPRRGCISPVARGVSTASVHRATPRRREVSRLTWRRNCPQWCSEGIWMTMHTVTRAVSHKSAYKITRVPKLRSMTAAKRWPIIDGLLGDPKICRLSSCTTDDGGSAAAASPASLGAITVVNYQRKIIIDIPQLRAQVRAMLHVLGVADHDVGISLLNDHRMREVNRQYRHIGKATDVLAFPFQDVSPPGARPPPFLCGRGLDTGILDLGDVYLCPPYIKRACDRSGLPFSYEVTVVTAHGICHLLGYDHQTDAEEEQMLLMEKRMVEAALALPAGTVEHADEAGELSHGIVVLSQEGSDNDGGDKASGDGSDYGGDSPVPRDISSDRMVEEATESRIRSDVQQPNVMRHRRGGSEDDTSQQQKRTGP